MTVKLNQIVALVKGKKSKLESELTQAYKTVQKSELFEGLERTYQPLEDDGEQFPPDSKKVVKNVNSLLNDIKPVLINTWDVILTQDMGNCLAKSDVKVDNEVVLEGVPATTLIFLEKQLTDLHTFISKLPTLTDQDEWSVDENDSDLYKSKTVQTSKMKKKDKIVVLYKHTPEHPAQTKLVHEDVLVGYWSNTKRSGAISVNQKKAWLNNVQKLKDAVVKSREEANSIEIEQQKMGEKILDFVFKSNH